MQAGARGRSSVVPGRDVAAPGHGEVANKGSHSGAAPVRASQASDLLSGEALAFVGDAAHGGDNGGVGGAGGQGSRSSAAQGITADTTGMTTGAKVSKKMSGFCGFLADPFWSPPSPPMPKRKKRRPESAGKFYTIPSQSIVPRASRSLSAGVQRRDRADTGGERQCYKSKKKQVFDESLFELGFKFEEKDDPQSGAMASGKDPLFDESLFDLGFDFKADGSSQDLAAIFDDNTFDLSFTCDVEGSTRSQAATTLQKVSTSGLSQSDPSFACDAEGSVRSQAAATSRKVSTSGLGKSDPSFACDEKSSMPSRATATLQKLPMFDDVFDLSFGCDGGGSISMPSQVSAEESKARSI